MLGLPPKQWHVGLVIAAAAGIFSARAASNPQEVQLFYGMCDASAAVALDARRLVVANDEDNRLRVYDRDRGGAPLQSFDLSRLLRVDPGSPETDIEAAAKLGDDVFWITSHGRNRRGRLRQSRHRLFATRFTATNNTVAVSLVGKPYERLLEDLMGAPQLRAFRLAEASTREPKARDALNIEGLCATPEGQLWIGFRNPIPQKRALLVPLLNPREIVQGKPAKLGQPHLLDLDGLGIRDMTFWAGQYVIVGGAADGGGKAHVFTWDGKSRRAEKMLDVRLKGLVPEAIVVYPDRGLERFQLLSDDGTRRLNGTPCKELRIEMARVFRAVWIDRAGFGGS